MYVRVCQETKMSSSLPSAASVATTGKTKDAPTRRKAAGSSSRSKTDRCKDHERYVEFADALGIEDASTKTLDELRLLVRSAEVDFEALEKLAKDMEESDDESGKAESKATAREKKASTNDKVAKTSKTQTKRTN